ncbi:pilus assembly protein TadG-related protein [Novosphingobium colocasiae]|uniref:pilus assembly protein TadG-related protein n=1 Tax=Novosphingobium colocasiae TaxID=1256513 RepID=UPI0035B06445
MIRRALTLLQRRLARLRADARGNVLILTALSLVPLTFAVGFSIDYTRAMKLRTRMNAAADAAALAAVNVAMMQQSDSAATAAARAMFNAQVSGLPDMIYDTTNPANPAVTIVSSGGVNIGWKVTVSYTAQSRNLFGGVLGKATLTINGSVTADATRAPHVDFYLLMDTSPSMLLPSTTTGLNSIRTATGCAFACHTQNPRSDAIYVRNAAGRDIWLDTASGNWCPVSATDSTYIYCTSGTRYRKSNGQYADSYWLTRNFSTLFGGSNITLRIDDEEAAAQQLIPFAINSAAGNRVTYRLQMFTYDWTHPGNTHPVKTITSTMADVNTLSSYDVPNFYGLQDNWYINNCPTSTYCNSDMGSEVHNALVRMNAVMATPGDGSTAASPQGVLFIITDGMADEVYNGTRWNREWNAQDLTDCTTIKNRGIRIAVLYTEYLPESMTGDSWSQANVAPYLANVEPALRSCASARADGTALYYKVTTDESIADALTALFALTVQTARLTR